MWRFLSSMRCKLGSAASMAIDATGPTPGMNDTARRAIGNANFAKGF